MPNQWEDDDFFDGDEDTDMGDEHITQAVKPAESKQVSSPIVETRVSRSERSETREPQRQHQGNNKSRRNVRVRPMPVSMQNKWPDVTSCLLTLASGKQVMFVKGG